jgi:hypothetical protein
MNSTTVSKGRSVMTPAVTVGPSKSRASSTVTTKVCAAAGAANTTSERSERARRGVGIGLWEGERT